MTIHSVGCGYFKDNRLIGFLEEGQARGANLLLNQAQGGTVEVEMPDGGVAALRLVKSRCEWELKVAEDAVVGMTAQLEVEADLAELRSVTDPESPAAQEALRQGLSGTIKKETESVLRLSQQEEADFLHLSRSAGIQRPWLKSAIEEHWDTWFPELELDVEVKGVVRRSYDVSEPMKEAEGKS